MSVRIRIIDVDGQMWGDIVLKTPPDSRQHVGKEGVIVDRSGPLDSPLLRLDDGTELYGYECWWEPIDATASGSG